MFVPMWMLVAAALGAAILIGLLIARGNDVRRDDMMGPPRTGLNGVNPRPAVNNPAGPEMDARITRITSDPEVRAALAAGNKIDAIKLVREKTGLGLKEAKDLVETM